MKAETLREGILALATQEGQNKGIAFERWLVATLPQIRSTEVAIPFSSSVVVARSSSSSRPPAFRRKISHWRKLMDAEPFCQRYRPWH